MRLVLAQKKINISFIDRKAYLKTIYNKGRICIIGQNQKKMRVELKKEEIDESPENINITNWEVCKLGNFIEENAINV